MQNTNGHKNLSILLTGVTGGLGSEMLPRLVRSYPHHTIMALIRGKDDVEVRKRLNEAAAYGHLTEDERNRVFALRGEVSNPNFGLDVVAWQSMATSVAQIFHLAANVNFDVPLNEARSANVNSTVEVLRFARQCLRNGPKDFRLNHVSTAYIVGDRRGKLKESELRCGQKFWNAYEQSKCEAEEIVTAATGEVPITVYRPSQVIGESGAGRIRKFFGFYEFVKLAARGKASMTLEFGDPNMRPDMVPSDYVCDAMLYFSRQPDAAGRTYHLAAGLEESICSDRLIDIVFGVLQSSPPQRSNLTRPRWKSTDNMSETQVLAFGGGSYHSSVLKLLVKSLLPYLSYERDFDVEKTRMRLASAGIVMPPIEQVVRITTQYAINQRYEESIRSTTSINNGVQLTNGTH